MVDLTDKRFELVLHQNKPSQTQIDLCNFVAHKIGNAIVESRAGSGKSKTIELISHFVPSDKKVLIVCFNKHIAEHLNNRLKLPNVSVMTYHSLGNKILQYKKIIKPKENFNENKYQNAINSIERFSNIYETLKPSQKISYKRNIEKLVNYARYNLAQSVKEIEKVGNKYGVPIFADECTITRNILKWGKENLNEYDYQDMIWLPYELGIQANIYHLQFDFIFIDEAQDSSIAQQNLLNICKKRNTRTIVFGDSFQEINSWAGSDDDAFKNFNKMPNLTQFKLNVSYRCGKKITELAKTIVPDIEASEWAIEGSVNEKVSLDEIKNGDMVLCRLTAPLVELYLKFAYQNKPVKIKGLEIGKELYREIASFSTDNIDEIRVELTKSLINEWLKLSQQYNCDLKQVVDYPEIMLQYDKLLTFNIITKGLSAKKDVLERINSLLINSDDNEIIDENFINLMTVHRAKGLEADNVFILCPSLMPSRIAKKDWEIKSENNLIYVAITRAKKTLNFIDENEFTTDKTYNSNETFYKELLKLKEKIC